MANVKITDLTAASTPLAGTELFETVQSSSSKKVAASDIGNSATAMPFLSLAGRAYIQAYSTTEHRQQRSRRDVLVPQERHQYRQFCQRCERAQGC